MPHTLTNRGAGASITSGGVLLACRVVTDRPWPLWAAWAALTVVPAVRSEP